MASLIIDYNKYCTKHSFLEPCENIKLYCILTLLCTDATVFFLGAGMYGSIILWMMYLSFEPIFKYPKMHFHLQIFTKYVIEYSEPYYVVSVC